MFGKTKQKLAETTNRKVKEAIEPIKTGVKKIANNKVDLYSRILRMGVLLLLFIDGTRRVSDMRQQDSGPNQIIINNYLGDRDKGR